VSHHNVREYYDSLAYKYDEKYENVTMSHMRHVESEVIRQYARDDLETVVDIGCGTGLHALVLGEKGHRVVGMDISGEMVKMATSKAKFLGLQDTVQFIQWDIENTLPGNPTFDLAISMFGALNHVESLERAFSNVKRILSPNGRFVFTAANYFSIYRLIKAGKSRRLTEMMRGDYPRTSKFFVSEVGKNLWTQYYTRSEIERDLRLSGFEVEKKGGILFFIKPQYHNSRDHLSKKRRILMHLERKTKWMFPVSYFSEYLLFVCRNSENV
jgi:ubiquinone/menaquinone biosynthesis C-methylase UbiE